MKVVDASVLLTAVNADATDHDSARGWLEAALRRDGAVGSTWAVLLAFLRLSTRPGHLPQAALGGAGRSRPGDGARSVALEEAVRSSNQVRR
jgi:predicted nucleic acid-binding protein